MQEPLKNCPGIKRALSKFALKHTSTLLHVVILTNVLMLARQLQKQRGKEEVIIIHGRKDVVSLCLVLSDGLPTCKECIDGVFSGYALLPNNIKHYANNLKFSK